jgi:hypothetical protein
MSNKEDLVLGFWLLPGARPMAMMRATMPSMRSVLLSFRLQVAGRVLGDGDVGGHSV